MKTLREALADYLAMRRALGFKLYRTGNALLNFVTFLEEREALHITTALALEWAQLPSTAMPATWSGRLRYVRGFARYLSALDPQNEIPSGALLPHRAKRARPYMYSEREVQQLLEAALELPTVHFLKRRTYHCLLGLLAVTGLRISEALNLKITNIDFSAGVLIVVDTKFGKSRLVPLHPTTQKALSDYKLCRDEFLKGHSAEYFLINTVGKRLDEGTVRRTFYLLSRQIGIRECNSSQGPRLHDFRHRFAIETLLQWYRNGEDAEQRLPILSTYLGHVHVSDTYWYLTAYPELMGAAVKRLEQHWEGKP